MTGLDWTSLSTSLSPPNENPQYRATKLLYLPDQGSNNRSEPYYNHNHGHDVPCAKKTHLTVPPPSSLPPHPSLLPRSNLPPNIHATPNPQYDIRRARKRRHPPHPTRNQDRAPRSAPRNVAISRWAHCLPAPQQPFTIHAPACRPPDTDMATERPPTMPGMLKTQSVLLHNEVL